MNWIPTSLDPENIHAYLANIQANENNFVCLDNAKYNSNHKKATWEIIAAWGEEEIYSAKEIVSVPKTLQQIWSSKKLRFGYLSYDLKNAFEALNSNNEELYASDLIRFFVPTNALKIENDVVYVSQKEILNKLTLDDSKHQKQHCEEWNPLVDQSSYKEVVKRLKDHIQRGDIFEINYCIPIRAKLNNIQPWQLFLKLKKHSPTPFLSYFQSGDKIVISASPERFIQKNGNQLISQPIKGTIKRAEGEKDEWIKNELKTNAKEKAENVMIVDLVRNDLSKIAKKNSVQVSELYGIYTFPQLHQMISTIACEIDDEVDLYQILKALFPMGSMTGAPKVEALKLIEKYESFQRGIYSGSIGYIDEENNFDFNVVIRSIIHEKGSKHLYFPVGSAITHYANEEQEYEECLLKAKAIVDVLTANEHA